jgi:hypothetical protein
VPVNFGFSSENAKGLMLKLGIPKPVIEAAESLGWKLALTDKEISLSKDSVTHAVPVSLAALQAANAGKLLPKDQAALESEVSALLAKACMTTGIDYAVVPQATTIDELPPLAVGANGGVTFTKPKPKQVWKYDPTISVIDNIKACRAITGLSLKEAKDTVEAEKFAYDATLTAGLHAAKAKGIQVLKAETVVSPVGLWPLFDLNKLKTAVTAKLRDASKMYQPVRGTSAGSRYFVVGGNPDLRIAARLQDGTLSIRIEGPAWKKHQSSLQGVGFDMHLDAKDYASVHLSVGDNMVLANKTLGAVLLGLGVQLETPLPNLKFIKEG